MFAIASGQVFGQDLLSSFSLPRTVAGADISMTKIPVTKNFECEDFIEMMFNDLVYWPAFGSGCNGKLKLSSTNKESIFSS